MTGAGPHVLPDAGVGSGCRRGRPLVFKLRKRGWPKRRGDLLSWLVCCGDKWSPGQCLGVRGQR